MSANTTPPSQQTDLVEPSRRPTKHWYDWAVRIGARLLAVEATAQAAADAVGAIPSAADPVVVVAGAGVDVGYEEVGNQYVVSLEPSVLAVRAIQGPPGQDGEPGEQGPPGPKGDKGDTGASGSGGSGQTIIIREEHYEDAWPIPGPKGDTGATGASGGGGGGVLVARVYSSTSTTASTTSTIPFDNTIPQNTEGVAYTALDKTYAATSATNLLKFTVYFGMVSANGSPGIHLAVFDGVSASAIGSTPGPTIPANTFMCHLLLEFIIVAGTTSSRTYTIRWGTQSGTGYLNQHPSIGALHGGANKAYMMIEEYTP